MSIFTRREEKESLARRSLMLVNSIMGLNLQVYNARDNENRYIICGSTKLCENLKIDQLIDAADAMLMLAHELKKKDLDDQNTNPVGPIKSDPELFCWNPDSLPSDPVKRDKEIIRRAIAMLISTERIEDARAYAKKHDAMDILEKMMK